VSRAGLRRRDLLRASGACGLLFPFLRPGAAGAALPATPRLVLLMQSNGTGQANFWPTLPGTLSSPILDPIVSDPALAARTTVVKGLFNDAGGSGNGHDQGFIGLYSGYRSDGSFNDPIGPGISLDQLLRTKLDLPEIFPTLNCGVLATDTPVFKSHRRSFSYTGPRQQVPTEVDPYKLYAQFFAVGPPPAPGEDPVAAARRRLMRKQTVLDYVTGDLRALRSRVGAFDRDKLDAHESALRQLERRLGATLLPDPGRPDRCGAVRGPTNGLDITAEDNAPELIKLMFDFLALAISCQLTRIVTFQFGHGGEKWFFRWLGIDENSHDDIAHRDDGTNPDITAKVLAINVWYAQQVAALAHALDRIPEGDGTALDNTLLVWGNEIATGIHTMSDIPVVLLGKAAGRLKRPGILVDEGPQDYHRLGTSLLNIMGVPATGFGEAPDCGPIQGLEI
jgi:Protein of unknown function (DUF1552)